ncbi:MAG TPA: DUF952 domain-containing protein [Candidatus Limnocylindrales bacterium]|nr:DUF952 domain-containing protein [Candidatus Limnocylindrales bacterium]
MRPSYHLTPCDWWASADPAEPLGAPSLADEGFIHCTDGAANMVATANRHYAADPRAFLVVTLDLDRVTSPWEVADEGAIYPHVFGPIDRSAILDVRPAPRAPDGTFLPFTD